MITLVLMGCVTVIFIILDYIVPCYFIRSDYFSSTNSFNFCQQSNRKENLINIIKEPPLEVPFVKKLF